MIISILQFLKGFERKMGEFYSGIRDRFQNFKLRLKIRKLLKTETRKSLSRDQKNEIQVFYRKNKIKKISTLWHTFYSNCNGIFSERYIPEDLFYVKIEPKFNSGVFYPALADKNLLDKLFNGIKQPETIIKNINGFYYCDDELISLEKAIAHCCTPEKKIIKPTLETWGGKDVLLFSAKDTKTESVQAIKQLFFDYKKNFIVQKIVQQHSKMSELNSTSLNTIRILTYLKESKVSILSTVVRIGREGSFTDNASMGGISCGVGRNGMLNEVGYGANGEKITETDRGLKLLEIEIPYIEKINSVAKNLHSKMPYFRIVSWDLAIDIFGNIILIEYNVRGQGINIHQLNNGPILTNLVEEYSQML